MTKNKIALITGASRGIGRAIAIIFAKDGYDIIINYRSSEEEANTTQTLFREANPSITTTLLQADVSSSEEVTTMFSRIPSLDVLINNAGWSTQIAHGDLESLSPEIYNRVMDTNFKGPYLCTREAIKIMTQGGSIINIASLSGLTGRGSNVIYCASKAALINLTTTMARALGPRGIRVNCIAPGLVETELTRSWRDMHTAAREQCALGRQATVEDIATATLYLTKMQGTTGEVLKVDGGQYLEQV